jgi:hypothetical protein
VSYLFRLFFLLANGLFEQYPKWLNKGLKLLDNVSFLEDIELTKGISIELTIEIVHQ